MSKFDDKFTVWYDRQSIETLFLIGVSPLVLIAVVLIAIALIFG